MTTPTGIDPSVPPSGEGCVECDASGGWWFHLRRCAQCGHVGCCDSSPAQHARQHAGATGHRVIRSFEPGESWFWDFAAEQPLEGPELAPPQHRPPGQPAPGPPGRVPADWKRRLHRSVTPPMTQGDRPRDPPGGQAAPAAAADAGGPDRDLA